MAAKKTCWDCKYNTLNLKILVPQNSSIQDYVHSTGALSSDIVAITKEKQGHYTIWLRHFNEVTRISFKIVHSCKLKIENENHNQFCTKHELAFEQGGISNITYTKASSPDLSTILLPKLKPSVFITHKSII